MNQSTALKANVGFGLVLALITAMACLSYQQTGRLADAARRTAGGYQAGSCLEHLQGQLKEAQSIQLAYTVGRSQALADRFTILTAEIANSLTQATQLTRGNKAQQSRLKAVSPVVKSRLRLTGENPQVITWMQTQVGGVEQEQASILQFLRKAEQFQATRAGTFILLTGLLSIGLVVGAGVTVKTCRRRKARPRSRIDAGQAIGRSRQPDQELPG